MSFEPVNVLVVDTSIAQTPIPDVVVSVLNQAGTETLTRGQTDSSGNVAFLLESGRTYQFRFYKYHTNFKPVYVPVLTTPATNYFVVKGEVFTPPLVQDQRLCMAYGFFRDMTGAPAANVEIIFISKFKPIWLEGAGLLTERRTIRTNENGYAEVSLIRCGQYDVTIAGYEDMLRCISVPDALNVNLPDLLFPIVDTVVFSPPGPYAVTVGGPDLVITPTFTSSDENVLTQDQVIASVIWSSSNDQVLAVIPAGGTVSLRGIAPGTAYVKATRADQTIIHIPDAGITGQPVLVTVT